MLVGSAIVRGMYLAFAFGLAELSMASAAQLIPCEALRATSGVLLQGANSSLSMTSCPWLPIREGGKARPHVWC